MELGVRKHSGFSLIELLIVVAIILIIAAIAIPNLLRARASAQEAAAVNHLKTVVTAETTYCDNLSQVAASSPCRPWRER